MKTIDLRSDTVTKPTREMLHAMSNADVGDDCYGEDPSVNRLQEAAAECVGKEAALFVPSGTMANQIAIRLFTRPGDVLVAGNEAHIITREGEAAQTLSGVKLVGIGSKGIFTSEDITKALQSLQDDIKITLLSFENTITTASGAVFPYHHMERIIPLVKKYRLALHLDGARLFNAVIASKIPAQQWSKFFDTVSFCLSKGLGAPVGSLLCGSKALIDEARSWRKKFGGSMRQAGYLAAAGLFALKHHTARLEEDHERALLLAQGLMALGLSVPSLPETNIVIFDVKNPEHFLQHTRQQGLFLYPLGGTRFRAVTHLDIGHHDVQETLDRLRRIVGVMA